MNIIFQMQSVFIEPFLKIDHLERLLTKKRCTFSWEMFVGMCFCISIILEFDRGDPEELVVGEN